MGASEQAFGEHGLQHSVEEAVFPADDAHRLKGHGLEVLRATIEAEIIPRLMLAHRAARPPLRAVRRDDAGTHISVEELTQLVLATESAPFVERVHALRDAGVSVERLMLDVLAPTAKRLGDLWSADLCSFTEVTLALGRLQYLVRDLSFADRERCAVALLPRRALIVSAPGEQHTFGASIVAEFLRREGWEVSNEICATGRELGIAVSQSSFALLGLSLSVDRGVDGLHGSIETARRESSNPDLSVLVGGRVFQDRPELVRAVGADGTAGDGAAVAAAAALVVHPPDCD